MKPDALPSFRRLVILAAFLAPATLLLGCGGAAPGLALQPTPTVPPRLPTATLAPTFTPRPPSSPTATATPTATPPPTLTPTATASPTPTVALTPAPERVAFSGVSHEWQKLNNCGPTTAAMALSIYGGTLTQFDAAAVLKGGPKDKNVSPAELARFLADHGLNAPILVNGDLDTLRVLVANRVPVIVEQWLERHDDPLTGHYRLVIGYDQPAGRFLVNDSYLGPSLSISEADFDRWWRAFNRLFIPVYPSEQSAVVAAILLGNGRDPSWEGAERTARAELASSPDVYAWFNLGTALAHQQRFAEAAAAFDQAVALRLPSERMLWYQFEPFEAYIKIGRPERALAISEPLVPLGIEEVHFYRGQALVALGRLDEARAEYRQALSLRARYPEAEAALVAAGGS